MSNFLDAIDKYKFGLIAALMAYVSGFIYLQMTTYEAPAFYEPFEDQSYVEIPEDEIELKPENILAPQGFEENVTNAARDVNDDRKQSDKNWSPNKSVADVEAEYRRLEEQMYQEAGGDKTREQIRKQVEAKKQAELDAARKNQNNTSTPTNGSDNAPKGAVLAEWELEGRSPHQNNSWNVRVPGYLCGSGSGAVMVRIKVNQNGNVMEANYSSSESYGANQCMIDNAVKYAKMSRFNYSSKTSQSGYILYRFVSQ